jgi:peptide/nickel transport system substrate-binding protein
MDDPSGRDGLLEEQTILTRAGLLRAGGALVATPALLAFADRASASLFVTPRRGGTIRAAFGGAPTDQLDIFKQFTSLGWPRARQIYEPLVEPDPTSSGVRFVLAESIRPNRDGTVWTIKLRDGIRWQDGSPLTADDVIYTIETYLDPANSARGGAPSFSGADPKRIEKVNSLTVRVGLKAGVADFVETLGADGGAFIAKKNSRGTKAQTIGTGPFKLAAFTPGQSSKLVSSGVYRRRRGSNGPYVDALELLNVTSEDARINALRDRQIEYAALLSPAAAKLNQHSSKVVLHASQRGAPYVFNMNIRVKPFDDPRVRLAFKLACNRKQLIDNTMLGFGVLGNDMYGLGTDEYPENIPQRPYDPAQARKLLQSAGASDLKVPIYAFDYGIGDLGLSAATVYAEQLKAVGVQATPINLPYAQFRADLERYTKTIPLYSYQQSDIAASVLWTYIYIASSVFDYTGWNRPPWEAKFNQARKTFDPKRRKALFAQLQRELWSDSGEIVWGFASNIGGLAPRLKGVVDAPDNYTSAPLFKDAWLARA